MVAYLSTINLSVSIVRAVISCRSLHCPVTAFQTKLYKPRAYKRHLTGDHFRVIVCLFFRNESSRETFNEI